MRLTKTEFAGAYVIDLEKREDDRGFFARFFCAKEFEEYGLETHFVQVNNSLSRERGTLRGLHYQIEPAAEVKIVRCLQGSLFDVILDLRPSSPTFGKSFGVILSAENRRMMYVPRGCAHGFVTLEQETEVLYLVSQFYSKELARDIRWNDPQFKIEWPIEPLVISERDKHHPNFNLEEVK